MKVEYKHKLEDYKIISTMGLRNYDIDSTSSISSSHVQCYEIYLRASASWFFSLGIDTLLKRVNTLEDVAIWLEAEAGNGLTKEEILAKLKGD